MRPIVNTAVRPIYALEKNMNIYDKIKQLHTSANRHKNGQK